MDSDGLLFQTAIDWARPNVPLRRPAVMPAQSIVGWTPVLAMSAFIGWLMAETPLRPLTPATVPVPINRRA